MAGTRGMGIRPASFQISYASGTKTTHRIAATPFLQGHSNTSKDNFSQTYTMQHYTPYQNPALNNLYTMLFCDGIEPYQANNTAPNEQPWATLFAEMPNEAALLQMANDAAQPSRVRLLAAHRLMGAAQNSPQLELLGVVVEVGLEEGLDVVAAYGDGTARYLNHSERAIIWESPNETSNALIENLWRQSITVVQQIGPWDKERLAPPGAGMVRLNFLVSGQLYFGQGPMNVFFQDAMAGPVLNATLQLMQFLTEMNGA